MRKLLFTALLLLSAPAFGESVPASPPEPAPAASALGNVTGGGCRKNEDCILGCRTGHEQERHACISVTEGSGQCMEGKILPPGGLFCECLTDVGQCGFVFPKSVQ